MRRWSRDYDVYFRDSLDRLYRVLFPKSFLHVIRDYGDIEPLPESCFRVVNNSTGEVLIGHYGPFPESGITG